LTALHYIDSVAFAYLLHDVLFTGTCKDFSNRSALSSDFWSPAEITRP